MADPDRGTRRRGRGERRGSGAGMGRAAPQAAGAPGPGLAPPSTDHARHARPGRGGPPALPDAGAAGAMAPVARFRNPRPRRAPARLLPPVRRGAHAALPHADARPDCVAAPAPRAGRPPDPAGGRRPHPASPRTAADRRSAVALGTAIAAGETHAEPGATRLSATPRGAGFPGARAEIMRPVPRTADRSQTGPGRPALCAQKDRPSHPPTRRHRVPRRSEAPTRHSMGLNHKKKPSTWRRSSDRLRFAARGGEEAVEDRICREETGGRQSYLIGLDATGPVH